MAFGSHTGAGRQQPNAEINMVPLIDVMLVLLVIFIVTAPLLTHAVKVDLPVAGSQPNDTKPEAVELSIKADGSVFWNAKRLDQSAWRAQMALAAAQTPPPEVQLRADGDLAYRHVAQIMADAISAGLTRIDFVTLPEVAP